MLQDSSIINKNHNSIITATNIFKSFDKKGSRTNFINNVLKDVSIEVEQGKISVLVGPSGAGKSTLLHILGTLDIPSAGKIILNVDNKTYNYSELNDFQLALIRNKYIGFIFQFHHLLPEFNVLENIMMPALIANTPQAKARTAANDLAVLVGISDIINQNPNEISGGEQQRAAIARSLINNPAIVIADEPTGNLDSDNTNNVIDLIKKINNEMGMTFLIATHNEQVTKQSDVIFNMKDGKII